MVRFFFNFLCAYIFNSRYDGYYDPIVYNIYVSYLRSFKNYTDGNATFTCLRQQWMNVCSLRWQTNEHILTYENPGKKYFTLEEIGKVGGSYNVFLQTSLPPEMRFYNPDEETYDSSQTAFKQVFPRGFAVEILQVYSGPPVIAYKFRHWGYMEGSFKEHTPTGELIEMFGIAIFEVLYTQSCISWNLALPILFCFFLGFYKCCKI